MSAGIIVSHFFSMLPSTLKYLYSVEPVRIHFPTKQPCTNDTFVHGCFAVKYILTGSTEQRYFKVDGSMEKKWDTVIPVDFKRLYAALHTVSFVYGCFAGKCILTGSTE
jgi:hypothetical protein